MDEIKGWIRESIKQTPTLVVLVAIVYLFLDHINKRSETLKEISDASIKTITQISERNNLVIIENSAALKENSKALGGMESILRERITR